MTHPLTILTGASRGMGLAMAEQLLAAGHDLLCISRKHNDELRAQGRRRRATLRPVVAGPVANRRPPPPGWKPGSPACPPKSTTRSP